MITTLRTDQADAFPVVQKVGLAAAVKGNEENVPLLARSLSTASSAHSTKIEWNVSNGKGRRVVWFNWTQIIRTPFGVSNVGLATEAYGGSLWETTKTKMLQKHLVDIETTIRDGRLFRQINYYLDEETNEWYPVETRGMGGVKFFLHRDPNEADHISLRLLRDCVFLDRSAIDFDGKTGEFLSEISLVVRPA